jgi:hypothetical protein
MEKLRIQFIASSRKVAEAWRILQGNTLPASKKSCGVKVGLSTILTLPLAAIPLLWLMRYLCGKLKNNARPIPKLKDVIQRTNLSHHNFNVFLMIRPIENFLLMQDIYCN